MNEYSFILQGLFIPVKSKMKNNIINIILIYINILVSYTNLGDISEKDNLSLFSFMQSEFIFIYWQALLEKSKIWLFEIWKIQGFLSPYYW